MIKTDRYVQTEAAGMLYRLIPVTEEIIRCVIGKEEIKGNDSLIIEKKEYPAVEFAAEENEEKLELKTGKVLASLELSSGRIEWKHADGTRWCIQDKADLTKIDVVRYTTGGEILYSVYVPFSYTASSLSASAASISICEISPGSFVISRYCASYTSCPFTVG